MRKTTKVFMSGRSQAVRIPKEFRFDTDEVMIEKDEISGIVKIIPKMDWEKFFAECDRIPEAKDFMADFKRDRSEPRPVFEDWNE